MMGGTSGLGDLDELYEAIILDHYRSPRNSAPVDDPDVTPLSGRRDPTCAGKIAGRNGGRRG